MKRHSKRQIAVSAATAVLLPVCVYALAGGLSRVWFDRAVEPRSSAETEIRDGAFYYNTLTADEQALYDVIVRAAERFATHSTGVTFVPNEREYANAIRAVLFDHPTLFYLLAEDCTLTASAYTASVSMAYIDDAIARCAQLDGVVASILERVSTAEDDREKAEMLRAELLLLCADTENAGHTAYDALIRGAADGFGYALAYQLLCDEVGIPCETVTGTVDGVPHAWNALTLAGVTGYSDLLWDDVPDSAAKEGLSFHAYDFIDFDEMEREGHCFDTPTLWSAHATDDYYEANGLFVDGIDALPAFLTPLLSEARRRGAPVIEFCIGADADSADVLSDAAIRDALTVAVGEANAVAYDGAVPRLRTVNRIYRTSQTRNTVTVRLFYEEGDT